MPVQRKKPRDASTKERRAKKAPVRPDEDRLIRITCTGCDFIEPEKLTPFQDELKWLEEKQYEKLKASILRHGLVFPGFAWKNGEINYIIDAHQRHRVVTKMLAEGYQLEGGKFPVTWVKARDERQAKELVLAAVSQYGRYDEDSIYAFVHENELDWSEIKPFADFPSLNMGKLEVGWFQDRDITDEADDAPEVPKKPTTKPGDVWTLGDHVLVCGDCRDPKVARKAVRQNALLMNTDPPYGIDYIGLKDGIPRSGFKNFRARGEHIDNDDLTSGPELQAFLEAAIRTAVPVLSSNPAFYLWHPMLTQGTFFAAAAAADILIHRQIIWVKPHMVLTRSGQYHWKHELCFYGWIRGKPCPWHGDQSQVSVWEIAEKAERTHPTQKPVELFVRPIRNHTKPGEWVYEPFAGSGSQLIAAEHEDRCCGAVEVDPAYCDVIVERWQEFTGKKAKRKKRAA